MSEADRSLEALPGAVSRLQALGLSVPDVPAERVDAEIRLYERLGARHRDRDPYNVYCAWLEQLDSFVSALTWLRARAS